MTIAVSETFVFSQAKLDALAMRQSDKNAVAALCPVTIKLLRGKHALLLFADGRQYDDVGRQRLDNALAAYTLNDSAIDPDTGNPIGVRGCNIADVYTTPAPSESVPLDRDAVAADVWRVAADRDAFLVRFPA